MMTTQLLSQYDDMAGAKTGNPVPVGALLAHLLFLREVGGLAAPTALSDTFGTKAFVEVRACRAHTCESDLHGVIALWLQSYTAMQRICKQDKKSALGRSCLTIFIQHASSLLVC